MNMALGLAESSSSFWIIPSMTGSNSAEALTATVLVESSAEATTCTSLAPLSSGCGSAGIPGSVNWRCPLLAPPPC